MQGARVGTRAGRERLGRGKPPQLRSLTPRTLPVQPEPTPQGRRHWCRLTEKYCTRIATPFQNYPLSVPFSTSKPFLPRPSAFISSLSPVRARAFLSLSLSLPFACLVLPFFLPLSLYLAALMSRAFSYSPCVLPPGHPGLRGILR